MENQSRAPFTGNEPDKANAPAGSAPTPSPLANFDFDKELDQGPTKPGPLMHQQSGKPGTMGGKKSKKGMWAVLIVLILLAFAGAAGYFYWQNTETQKQVDTKQSEVASLQAQNSKLNTDLNEAKATAAATPKTQTAAEKAAADKTAVTKIAEAYIASSLTNPTWVVQSVTVEGAFAKAGTGVKDSQEGGKRLILKKAGDQWVIIWSGVAGGVSETDKAALKKEYGVPDSMLS